MKRITVTIDLEDEEVAWLEGLKRFHRTPPHAPLTIDEKVALCVFHAWSLSERKDDQGHKTDFDDVPF